MGETPQLNFTMTPLTGSGFPVQNDEPFQTILQQAVSGGEGTTFYLQHMQKYADFASYLNGAGDSAYNYEEGPEGSQEASATDGQTTMRVNVQLSTASNSLLYAGRPGEPPPVHGIATVSLQLPAPESVDKLVNLLIGLTEIPPGIAAGNSLMDLLFKPLVRKLSQFIRKTIENWSEIDLGEDLDGAGDAILDAASDAAGEIGEEATEIVVEEVTADLLVDLSAAAPPLAVLGALVAIPMIVQALEKQFVLHLEVNNLTEYDLEWSVAYMDEGTMTSQPAVDVVPKVGRARDIWGDETDVPVVYQANFSSMNKSGFTGIGFVLHLTPRGAEAGTDIAAVISIPWLTDNVIWLGDVPSHPDWGAIYEEASGARNQLSVNHGNLEFYTELAINALEGNNDEYYCVLTIEPL